MFRYRPFPPRLQHSDGRGRWIHPPQTRHDAVVVRSSKKGTDMAIALRTLENGKPYASEALGDIDETAENFRIAAEDVKRMETAVIPSRDPGKRILTFRKPNGVYAAITPWNFPTLIPVELIAPGIAAGNTIVIKPSEWTPIAMANFMQIMADAGLPDGVVNVVYGGGDVGESLVTHPGVDCIGLVG